MQHAATLGRGLDASVAAKPDQLPAMALLVASYDFRASTNAALSSKFGSEGAGLAIYRLFRQGLRLMWNPTVLSLKIAGLSGLRVARDQRRSATRLLSQQDTERYTGSRALQSTSCWLRCGVGPNQFRRTGGRRNVNSPFLIHLQKNPKPVHLAADGCSNGMASNCGAGSAKAVFRTA